MGLRDRLSKAAAALRGDNEEEQSDSQDAGEDDAPSAAQMATVLKRVGLPDPTEEKPRALFHDPYAVLDWGGWREKPNAITYETLRQMASQCTVVAAIIQVRVNQVAAFCKPQQGRYDRGYRVILRDRRDQRRAMSDQETLQAAEIERALETTGFLQPDEKPSDRDSLKAFVKKLARDTLIYDQAVFEKIRDRKGRVSRFICLPSETIRPAVADIEHIDAKEMRQRVSHVQVYEDTVIAEFSPDDIAWCVMNPRSDLRASTFGLSPVEQLITLITAWLFGFTYNMKFFTQGANIKGLLNIKGSIPDRQLKAFRRMWYSMVAGVGNCLAGSSVVWTRQHGAIALGDLLAAQKEREVTVWTGKAWVPALAYRTTPKQKCSLRLANGVFVESSADHRFRVIDEYGELNWKRQEELAIGDYVAVNAVPIETIRTQLPKYKGKELTPELAEVLGWSIGDGYLAFDKARTQGAQHYLSLYYHHDKEVAVRDTHCEVLRSFGIPARSIDKEVTEEDAAAICERYGFRTIAKVRRKIEIHSVEFTEWMLSLGFAPSRLGKQIPGCVHGWPTEHKAAFLRGLFSADGNNAKGRSPAITIADDGLREQAKLLLLSLGIRTSLSEGRTKTVIDGAGRSRIEAKSVLRIKDRDRFFAVVGFLQEHKQPIALKDPIESNKYDRLSPAATIKFCRVIREALKGRPVAEIKKERDYLNGVICGIDGCSRARLLRFAEFAGVELPSWVTEYHFEPVVEIERTAEVAPMYDLQVYDDQHQFMANGIASHNSWRTPILNSEDIQWVPMHSTNSEMEYAAWMDWLTKIICGIFGMDPLEINFIFGNTGQKAALNQARPNEDQVVESKDKGLTPLVEFIEDCINQHIIWELNPDFEFAFTGLNAKEEKQQREGWIAQAKSYKTVDEIRAEQDLDPLPEKKGEVILDSVWLQASQGAAGGQGGPEGGGAGEPGGGPLEKLNEGDEENPEQGEQGEEQDNPDEEQIEKPEEPDGEEGASEKQLAQRAAKSIDAVMGNLSKVVSGKSEVLSKGRRRIVLDIGD